MPYRAKWIPGMLAAASLLGACGSSEGDDVVARAGDLGHIHDLVITDAASCA